MQHHQFSSYQDNSLPSMSTTSSPSTSAGLHTHPNNDYRVEESGSPPSPPYHGDESTTGSNSKAGQSKKEPVKKKRKQVKCDKAEMAGGDCSECMKKNIKCTDAYVKSKPKVMRSGKLIQQAKQLYGDVPENDDDEVKPQIGLNASARATPEFDGLLYAASAAASSGPKPTDLVRGPQARLVKTQLGLELQDNLVQTYFSVFQEQMHVVDWTSFHKTWEKSGRNSEAMSPTNECLAVAIQAFAARFSDHPIALGQDGNLSSLPSLKDLRNHPHRDYSDFGNRREPFARAMLDRAIRTIDELGAWRKTSASTCCALLLLEFLTILDPREPNLGARSILLNCAEHMRILNEPNFVSADPDERPVPAEQISGGTLLWTVYARDALAAVIRRRPLCFTDEDLAGLSDLLAIKPHASEIMASVSSDNPQILLGLAVVSVFRHVTGAIRELAKATSAVPRRQRLNEAAIREFWSELDQSTRYSAIFKESVNRMDWTSFPTAKAQTWFRDVTVMHAQISLGLHRIIVDRWESESNDERALMKDPTFALYVDMLSRLKQQSDERFLTCIRDCAGYWRGKGTLIIYEALLSTEFAKDYLNHMLSMRTWEEGGPANWTWEEKKQDSQAIIDVLKSRGWCWEGHDVLAAEATRRLAEEQIRVEMANRRRQASGPGSHDYTNGSSGHTPFSVASTGSWRSPTTVSTPQPYPTPSLNLGSEHAHLPSNGSSSSYPAAAAYAPYPLESGHTASSSLASYGLNAASSAPYYVAGHAKDKFVHLLGGEGGLSSGGAPANGENGTQWR